ncbi:ECF transporter S component [Fructobacillus fructosus]|uniref:Permease component (YkoE) n=1 Tax=Fructobacillus fructosus TaxID=1631 RepID=A0ABN9YMH6_9LACO|nr:ECF transporter S component [Fructobacillus fructosus]MBD9364553.1 ECF transporter S component [Leuconostoc mesenteroides]MBC9118332.1 ECF transporter S component [Fructobacillus fructosus]MCK8638022.1 ECF transporter S component [Fructobacillus fructosus]CAK1223118.1 ABC-type thiamine/hydroxymethylpyrimidine transport system [Fructobacillus fructosus]CAK1228638.1 ABC-type thiamine/hydroxymethylpyrimidine transport system [Fructobacillus fructosus]
MKNTQWKLRDAILLALIGIIFSVIYFLMDPMYQIISGALTTVGLQAFAGELTIGVWMMAGPLAAYVLKKPGTALLAEMIGAAGEMFLGGYWGVATLLAGLIQGAGSELGFTLTAYKNWKLGLWLSTLTGTVVTFGWQYLQSGFGNYHFGMLLLLFAVRYLSIFFFAGVLVNWIEKLLDRSKFLRTDND